MIIRIKAPLEMYITASYPGFEQMCCQITQATYFVRDREASECPAQAISAL